MQMNCQYKRERREAQAFVLGKAYGRQPQGDKTEAELLALLDKIK